MKITMIMEKIYDYISSMLYEGKKLTPSEF